jgi:iron complex transport system ATP-binding protein
VALADVHMAGSLVLPSMSFTAMPGEFVAICGPNGAGKTTLLRALAGLIPPGRPDPARIAYVEQGARCAWGLTVRQVAALGRIAHGDAQAAPVDRAMAACGVAAFADRRIDRLSGGEARRAMLARALATEPEVLLLDEPTADLDPGAAQAVMALLDRFAAAGGIVVAVLHAVELAALYASRLVVMAQGRVVADGVPDAVLDAAVAAFGLRHREELGGRRRVGGVQ